MLIDCDTCEVRDVACDDCVVSVLLGPTRLAPDDVTFAGTLPAGARAPMGVYALADDEQAALAVLADSGLVPPLRLVPPAPAPGPASTRIGPTQRSRPGTLCDPSHVLSRRRPPIGAARLILHTRRR